MSLEPARQAAPRNTVIRTNGDLRQLCADAAVEMMEGGLARPVISVVADCLGLVTRLDMKALSIAKHATKETFEAVFMGTYAAEQSVLRDTAASLYHGRVTVSDARAVLRKIRAETKPSAPGRVGSVAVYTR